MKKYNVIDLYVIEINNHKFICEKIFDNEYKEVITKTKISIENNEKVERLIEYYSIHVRLCLNSKQTLMLTKKDIFLKYLEINEKTMCKEIPYKEVPINKTLTDEEMSNVLIDMWNTYVESKKDSLPDIPIINAKELQKTKKQ